MWKKRCTMSPGPVGTDGQFLTLRCRRASHSNLDDTIEHGTPRAGCHYDDTAVGVFPLSAPRTLTESRPSDLIRIKLEFLKPFRTTSAAEFTFTPTAITPS